MGEGSQRDEYTITEVQSVEEPLDALIFSLVGSDVVQEA